MLRYRASGFMTQMRASEIALIVILSLGAHSYLHAGSILGDVKFNGVAPKLKEIQVTKDQDYCGERIPNETYLFGSGGAFRNVVVFLEKPPSQTTPLTREHVLNNQGCRFVPRVMAMTLGDKLILKNSDPKLHIVHSYLQERTVFNASLPFKGHSLEITHKVRKPGLMQVSCDTHAWMRGYIYVFDHPFFAVTDDQGRFTIPNIPAGRYTLSAWHEQAGVQSKEVIVTDKEDLTVNFGFPGK